MHMRQLRGHAEYPRFGAELLHSLPPRCHRNVADLTDRDLTHSFIAARTVSKGNKGHGIPILSAQYAADSLDSQVVMVRRGIWQREHAGTSKVPCPRCVAILSRLLHQETSGNSLNKLVRPGNRRLSADGRAGIAPAQTSRIHYPLRAMVSASAAASSPELNRNSVPYQGLTRPSKSIRKRDGIA